MKLVSGSVLLLAAEQAYGHAQLVPFTNRDAAIQVFIPASLLFLTVGSLLLVWGLLTEVRSPRKPSP